ncbi:MAG: tail fiber domain-containing protein [Actinobacteria bacterium]|nr:tail fiber domain-containing protein [Actinomycetota bacterium]
MSLSGTVTAGTFVSATYTGANMSLSGTVTAANLRATSTMIAATYTGANLSLSGTVTAANLRATNVVSTNITTNSLVVTNGSLSVGGTNASSMLTLSGTSSSLLGSPVVNSYVGDLFPASQILTYAHDNISLGMDVYWDGSWRTGTTNGFIIQKYQSLFRIYPAVGSAGGLTNLNNAALTINTAGNVGLGNNTNPTFTLDVNGNARFQSSSTGGITLGTTNGTGPTSIAILHSAGTLEFGIAQTSGSFSGNALVGDAVIRTGNKNLMLQAQASTASLYITSSGNIGIGNTAPSFLLQLSSDSAAKPSTNTWTVSSDMRLKTNITLANLDICYANIKNLPLKRYTWRDDVYTSEQVPDRSKLGWIAQDVESVLPKAVQQTDAYGYSDCRTLNSDQIIASLYGAVQKLINKVEALESQLANSNQTQQ